jgi:hypothetical protein
MNAIIVIPCVRAFASIGSTITRTIVRSFTRFVASVSHGLVIKLASHVAVASSLSPPE